MAQTVKVTVFKDVHLSAILDKRYVTKTTTCDMVYNQDGIAIFRQCNLRNLRNAAYFFDVIFVAQHDEHPEFIVSTSSNANTDLKKVTQLERQTKIELINKIKAEWGIDLMKRPA